MAERLQLLRRHLGSRERLPEREFGGGFRAPVVGVGTWSFGSTEGEYWGAREQASTNAIVAAALQYGPVLFDTAEAYQSGRSETALAAALAAADPAAAAAARLATKILPSSCGDVRGALAASRARLGLGPGQPIELYQVHWPLPAEEVPRVFGELAALQREGLIKHIGVSNFGVQQMRAALATGATIATNQLCYNLLTRGLELELLPLLKAHGVGIIAYSPLLQGLLTDKGLAIDSFDDVDAVRLRTRHFAGARDKSRHGGAGHEPLLLQTLAAIRRIASRAGRPAAELATAWILANEQVMCVIPGASSVRQLEANMLAGLRPLDRAVKAELDAATAALRAAMGPALDPYESDAGQRSF